MREVDNGRTYHQRDRFLRDVVRAENHFAFFGHGRRSVYFCLPWNTQQLKEDKDGWMIAVVTYDSNRRKETRNWVDSVVGCTGRLLGLLLYSWGSLTDTDKEDIYRWCCEMVAFDLVLAPFNFNEPTGFEHWYSATPPLFYPSRYPSHKDV